MIGFDFRIKFIVVVLRVRDHIVHHTPLIQRLHSSVLHQTFLQRLLDQYECSVNILLSPLHPTDQNEKIIKSENNEKNYYGTF